MVSKRPQSYLATGEDLPLIQLTHTFMQGSVWLAEGMDKRIATFDLFVRDMPANRNFMLFGGLEEILDWIGRLRFSESEIQFLLERKGILPSFVEYLRNFRFTGNVSAMPEGTAFFPYEPVVRVTAPIIEASLFEVFLFTALVSNTAYLSKAARMKLAARDKFKVLTGPLRGPAFESLFKACRAAHLCGITMNATGAFHRKYNLTPPERYVANAQHLFIKSFPDELTAFETMIKYNGEYSAFMIDTYNYKQGVENVIKAAGKLRKAGKSFRAVTVDSGNLVERTKYVRERLDRAGFKDVKIFVASNLDEHKIKNLADKNAPVDFAVAVTEYATLSDSPKLEVVYKLAELRDGGKIQYAAKLATGKLSYPGRKQVFRNYDDKGKILSDTIALEDEKVSGTPLLQEVMRDGKVVGELPDIESLKTYTLGQLEKLPEYLKSLDQSKPYPVSVSPKIMEILAGLKKEHGHDDE